MPYTTDWFGKFWPVIEAVIRNVGYKPTIGKDIAKSGHIVDQVWEYIRCADAVVADLSGRNPNVFYEVGATHALGNPGWRDGLRVVRR